MPTTFKMSRGAIVKNDKGHEIVQLVRCGEGASSAYPIGEISDFEVDGEQIADKILELWNNQ